LKVGGILMLGMDIEGHFNDNLPHMDGNILEKPAAGLTLEKQMEAIKRSFEKHGFRAEFCKYEGDEKKLSDWMLIAQRVR
jgi:hypothetical protein